jgi:thiol-disulfide isomerase/thioredoxin
VSPGKTGFLFGCATGVLSVVVLIALGLFGFYYYVQQNPEKQAQGSVQLPETASFSYDHTLTTLEGEQLDLADLRGMAVMASMWTPNCPRCWASLPSLQRLYDEIKDDDIAFVSIAIGEEADIAGAIERFGLSFPVYRETKDNEENVPEVIWPDSTPTGMVVAPDGSIALKYAGPVKWDSDETVEFLREMAARPVPEVIDVEDDAASVEIAPEAEATAAE